jgi:hypothetical protein
MLKEKDLERQIKWFNELGEVCCKCPLFVLNRGWCDPL